MADYMFASEAENELLKFRRLIAEVRIVLFAAVIRVSTPPLRVSCQPLTMLKRTLGKDVSYIALPELVDVPVMLPYAQSTGLMLTLPIAEGDVGMLLVPDSAIDNVMSTPEVAAPPIYGNPAFCTPRSRELEDAVFIPGLVTSYFDIEQYNLTHIELRDKGRKNYISLGPDGITLTDGTAVMKISGGKITSNAPAGIDNTTSGHISNVAAGLMKIQSTNFNTGADGALGESTITGSLRSTQGTFTDKDGKILGSHTHNYTDDGTSKVTDKPNAG